MKEEIKKKLYKDSLSEWGVTIIKVVFVMFAIELIIRYFI